MKNALKILALILSICLTLPLVACNPSSGDPDGNSKANQNVVALAGDYVLDGTDYGMAKQWYIHIGSDETFKISSLADFSEDKGHGTVKESSGTFMFIYSDSTAEKSKTATFTVVDGNLVFSTAIPVGSVNFANQNEGSDGTVVVYPSANVPTCVGSFAGEMDKASGMGGSVHYDFTLDVKANGTYRYTSTFSMMGGTYVYAEEGTVKTSGAAVTLKALKKVTSANMETGELTDVAEAEQSEVVGSVADGVITIDMYPSPMSSAASSVTLYNVPSYAGSYTGALDKAGMGGANTHYDFVFSIKYDGTYKYTSTFAMMGGTYVYAEEGTVTVENGYALTAKALKKVTSANLETGELTDIAAEDQTAVSGTLGMGGTLTISLFTSPMASAATELSLEKQ